MSSSAAGDKGPSPLVIGTSFIKKYYQALSYNPDQIHKFYKPSSVISHSLQVGDPATPQTLLEYGPDKFFDWVQKKPAGGDVIQFDLEGGAIDAQESINGGVLLVVTGLMTLPGASKARQFVHTFFLASNSPAPGQKKQFYVNNDILRFLSNSVEEQEEVVEKEEAIAEDKPEEVSAPLDKVEAAAEPPAPVVEEAAEAPEEVAKPVEEEAPAVSEAVEETKEEVVLVKDDEKVLAEAPATAPAPAADVAVDGESGPVAEPKKRERSRSRRSGRGKDQQKQQQHRKSNGEAAEDEVKPKPTPKPPGSWASLVASGNNAGNAVITQPPPAPPTPTEKVETKEEETGKEATAAAGGAATGGERRRDGDKPRGGRTSAAVGATPECTLYVRNVPDGTKEAEFRQMFETFAGRTDSKLLGITLNSHRGYAFVDFDSIAAVEAALTEKFSVHGRTLEVERKTRNRPQQQQQGGRGGFRQNQSPGRNGNVRNDGAGGGGRQNSMRQGRSRRGSGGGGGNRSGGAR